MIVAKVFFEIKVRSQNHFPGCENICLICEERLEMEKVKRKKENIPKEIIHPPISISKTVNKFQDDTQPIEKMSLTLIKKNRAINSGDLVFQNTIRFTHDIVFKADDEYVYSGWIQSDGSINLKIISIEKESKIDYMKVENDLKNAKDILQKFDNLPDAHDSNW